MKSRFINIIAFRFVINKVFFSVLLLMVGNIFLHGQSNVKDKNSALKEKDNDYVQGMKYYRESKYVLAEENLQVWIKHSRNNTDVKGIEALGDCYWINRKYKDAYEIYKNLAAKQQLSNAKLVKRLADLEAMNNNYAAAAQVITENSSSLSKKEEGFTNYTDYLKDSLRWSIRYLNLNGEETLEAFPYVYSNYLIYTSDAINTSRTDYNYLSGKNYLSLQFIADTINGHDELDYLHKHGSFEKFSETNLKIGYKKLAIMHSNSDANLIPKEPKIGSSLSRDGYNTSSVKIIPRQLYNTAEISIQNGDRTTGKKPVAYYMGNDESVSLSKRFSKADSVIVPLKIYKGDFSTDHDNLVISNPVAMNIEGFDGQLQSMSVSRDGYLLVFSGKDTGSKSYDLYTATRKTEDSWENVKKLDFNINTEAGDEVYPQIQENGALFFSSDGLPGLGALDIYYIPEFYKEGVINTRILETTKPVHLSYPVNSAFDDYGLYVSHNPESKSYKDLDNLEGFFTTNRYGSDDIYSVKYITEYYNYAGKVYGKLQDGTMQLLPGANVSLMELNIDKPFEKEAKTDINGEYSYSLKPEQDYKLTAHKTGWIPTSIMYSTASNGNAIPDIILEKEPDAANIGANNTGNTGEIVISWMIHHEFDKTDIISQDKKIIDSVVTAYKSNPTNISIEIFSTADCYGSVGHNKILAKNRSEYIRKALVLRGVKKVTKTDSKATGERYVACPEVRDAANIKKQLANRYTRIFITIKKQ